MPTVIEAGSDMASLCLFDPAALPPDFLQRPVRERKKLVERLAGTEAALRLRTGADGSFCVHIYLDEDPPEHAGELIGDKSMVTSSGSFCLTGEEDVRPQEAESLGRSALPVPVGRYAVRAWRLPGREGAEVETVKQRVIAELGADAWEKYSRGSPFQVLTVIALILGGLFCAGATFARLRGWGHFGWPELAGLWMGWLILIQIVPRLMTSPLHTRIALIQIAAQRDVPAYIIHLTRA